MIRVLYRKKFFAFATLFTVLALSACGKYKALNVSTRDLAEEIAVIADIKNKNLTDLTKGGSAEMYGVAREDISEGYLYSSENQDDITFVAVVKAKNEDTLAHIELALRAEANELSRAWRYDEYKSRLSDNRLLKSRGLYTVLAVTENTDEVESVFDEMLSTE